MNDSPYITEADARDFAAKVIERSHEVPVLVDFWAAWCAPCKVLMPMLAKLADEYRGRFLLVKVNTDEQRDLAADYGIRSLPTVKVFKFGAIVDEILGAVPESELRSLVERNLVRPAERLQDAARAAYERGDTAEAARLLREVLAAEPDNASARIELARVLLETEDLDEAALLLENLPADARMSDEVVALTGYLEFARIARGAPDAVTLEKEVASRPRDCEPRYRLAARKLLAGDHEGAMDQLLEIMRIDRGFGDDAGRRGLLAVFSLLGGRGELVNRYRGRMFTLLH